MSSAADSRNGPTVGLDEDDAEPDAISAVRPAPHEASANLIFTADGLRPFYALDAVIKDAGGSDSATVELAGNRYELTLYYQESGLKPWDNPEFRIETVREFRIKVEGLTDGVDERGGTFHIAPRWPDMESKGDSPNPSTPDIVGVNVRVDGSNIRLHRYPELLRRAADAFGIDAEYFADGKIHEFSNVFQYEQYVRLDRKKSRQLVGRGGPLEQVFEYVETVADFRELREDNRDTFGYHHRVKFDSASAGKLIDGHRFGKKIKHYHPEHVRSDPDDPLYHPKVGVSLQQNLTADTVRWSHLDELRTEVDELLINLLSWAGLSTRSNGPYIPDEYFDATESVRELRLVENPLPEIKRKQETTVVDGLTANPDLNESDREVLELVTDGGRQTVDELAADASYSKRTIYRVVDRLESILSTHAGEIRFQSDFIRRTVRTTLSDVKDSLTSAGQSAGDTADPFRKWANAHGVEVDDSDDARLTLRFGRIPGREDMMRILREGRRAWKQSGRNGRRFSVGQAEYKQGGRLNIRCPIFVG